MLTNLNSKEGQEDLRIVEHLDMQKLPESVQQMLSLANTPEEQDIILMATLAAAYRMIDGDAQDVVPEIKPIDQRKVLFEQLKAEYALGELISEAKSQGVSRSSAIRWNNQWIEQGLITKENHGNYKKVA